MNADKKISNLDWGDVEEALSEKSAAGYKMAVLETDKLFREHIGKFGYLGTDLNEKLKNLGKLLNKSETLKSLRNIRENIVEEKKFDISREDAKEIISEYWQIIKALEEFNLRTRPTEKFWLRLKNSSFLYFLKFFLIGFAALVLLVELFDRTAVGKEVVLGVAKIADLLFLEVAVAAGIVAALFSVWKIRRFVRRRNLKK